MLIYKAALKSNKILKALNLILDTTITNQHVKLIYKTNLLSILPTDLRNSLLHCPFLYADMQGNTNPLTVEEHMIYSLSHFASTSSLMKEITFYQCHKKGIRGMLLFHIEILPRAFLLLPSTGLPWQWHKPPRIRFLLFRIDSN